MRKARVQFKTMYDTVQDVLHILPINTPRG